MGVSRYGTVRGGAKFSSGPGQAGARLIALLNVDKCPVRWSQRLEPRPPHKSTDPIGGASPATRGSRATFDFPQNSFVWENKKIDSRPPKPQTPRTRVYQRGPKLACAPQGQAHTAECILDAAAPVEWLG